MTTQDFMWLAIGIACLMVALGVGFVCWRLSQVLVRADGTLGKVERQLDSIQRPIAETVEHVGGVAANVDAMVGRVSRITEAAEKAADAIAKSADAAQSKISPALLSFVGVLAGVSEGAKSFFRPRGGNGQKWP